MKPGDLGGGGRAMRKYGKYSLQLPVRRAVSYLWAVIPDSILLSKGRCAIDCRLPYARDQFIWQVRGVVPKPRHNQIYSKKIPLIYVGVTKQQPRSLPWNQLRSRLHARTINSTASRIINVTCSLISAPGCRTHQLITCTPA
jgi:hypothetical protein